MLVPSGHWCQPGLSPEFQDLGLSRCKLVVSDKYNRSGCLTNLADTFKQVTARMRPE